LSSGVYRGLGERCPVYTVGPVPEVWGQRQAGEDLPSHLRRTKRAENGAPFDWWRAGKSNSKCGGLSTPAANSAPPVEMTCVWQCGKQGRLRSR